MKKNYYRGFFYETEDELKGKLTDDEYFDFIYEERNKELEIKAFLMGADDPYNDYSSLSLDTYAMRQAEGLTQMEFAGKLGISVSTLSKIENGQGNVSRNVKIKTQNYFDEQYP